MLIAGNGPEKEAIEEEVNRLNLNNNIKMLGYCTCLEKYQRITDVSVSCSKREGLPLNIVEAMLSENPVVATANRGHCELIEENKNGFIVQVDDVDSMANHIRELLNDDDMRMKFGKNAREFAVQYGFTSVKKELEKIYFNC